MNVNLNVRDNFQLKMRNFKMLNIQIHSIQVKFSKKTHMLM